MAEGEMAAEPPLNYAALVESALLALTGLVLLTKALRGVLDFYIHPRYGPLVVACAAVLLGVAGARLRAVFRSAPEPLRGRRAAYMLLLVPILVGTVVPARPLGSGGLAGAGLDQAAAGAEAPSLDEDTARWDLLRWATALSVSDPGALRGRPADVVGFVYHDPARPLDGFFVVRYVVTCCTADSNGVGLPVVWRGGASLPKDGWVRVRGALGAAAVGGAEEPALVAESVEPVPAPSPPYIYP